MGNARWKGVRLKDVLARAGLKADALKIVFNGADQGASDKTPDFIKSLPVWKALDENTWMKQVISIRAMPRPESGFWMSAAYRIPRGKFR